MARWATNTSARSIKSFANKAGRFWLGNETHQLNLHLDQMQDVGELAFGVGDSVRLADGRAAEIVDCVWHYAKAQPMYFLAFETKKSSRRYFADELSAVTETF